MNVTLSGFSHVVRAHVFQGVGAYPGRAVVETVGTGISEYPEVTTLTMSNDDTTRSWTDMRVIRAPVLTNGRVRVVLEDSRWKLQALTLTQNFNSRDGLGNLDPSTEKTAAELMAILGGAAGLTMLPGLEVPDWNPPAQWRGKRGDAALADYLRDSVCRLVYNPISRQYKLWKAGMGELDDFDKRLSRPEPIREVHNVRLETAPIVHEERMDATAVVDNAAGRYENLSGYDGDGYVDDFIDYDGNEMRERLQQSAFRMWRVNNAGREILPHRALPLTIDPSRTAYASSRLVHTNIQGQMRQYPVVPGGGDREMLCTTGGTLFWSDDPFLESEGGSFKTEAKLLTAYYRIVNSQRQRLFRDVIGAGSDKVHLHRAEWIRPFTSSEGVGTSQWEDAIDAVADALHTKFSSHPQTVTLPGMVEFLESGRIGGVSYYAQSENVVQTAMTKVSVDFEPRQKREERHAV